MLTQPTDCTIFFPPAVLKVCSTIPCDLRNGNAWFVVIIAMRVDLAPLVLTLFAPSLFPI